MSYWAIGISLFVGLAFWYMERNFYNPGTIMGFLWTLICVLAKMRAFELYAASDYTYLLISIALAMFGLGCVVARNMRTKFSSGIHLHLLYKSGKRLLIIPLSVFCVCCRLLSWQITQLIMPKI